jgi:hypothetical protein
MMNLRMLVAAGICSHFGTMADDAIYPVANTKGYESPSGWTLSGICPEHSSENVSSMNFGAVTVKPFRYTP